MTSRNIASASQVTVIGAGFTGLAAAYELAKKGVGVTLLEAEGELGGLAAAFHVGEQKLDRFYHHWFTNDQEVMDLITELGLRNLVRIHSTNTGIYCNSKFFKLSSPWDLLKFTPLRLFNRIRLGLMTLQARQITDWRVLENVTAREWLQKLGGEEVYRVVWQPLLQGKFGPYAEQVSAVWFWNKLKLRGGSRGKRGEERLAYFQGGFIALLEAMAEKIFASGGHIEFHAPATEIKPVQDKWLIDTPRGSISSDRVITTTALPLIADMIGTWASPEYIESLRRIRYLGNICLVLELDRPLSHLYWTNVNNPSFPFVGIIEHTNFERPDSYGGRHIVYLSKYLAPTDPLYNMDGKEFLHYAFPYLKAMFPSLEQQWIQAHHLWRARWSQPVVEKHYSALIPAQDGPREGFHICSMAQVYPEDRGTNYAIREGRRLGRRLAGIMA
jgi:protoporphyrinogen oxidase